MHEITSEVTKINNKNVLDGQLTSTELPLKNVLYGNNLQSKTFLQENQLPIKLPTKNILQKQQMPAKLQTRNIIARQQIFPDILTVALENQKKCTLPPDNFTPMPQQNSFYNTNTQLYPKMINLTTQNAISVVANNTRSTASSQTHFYNSTPSSLSSLFPTEQAIVRLNTSLSENSVINVPLEITINGVSNIPNYFFNDKELQKFNNTSTINQTEPIKLTSQSAIEQNSAVLPNISLFMTILIIYITLMHFFC